MLLEGDFATLAVVEADVVQTMRSMTFAMLTTAAKYADDVDGFAECSADTGLLLRQCWDGMRIRVGTETDAELDHGVD